MREAMKHCGRSRDQVADKMTELMKAEGLRMPGNSKSVSRAILDKWVSDSASHMMPVSLLPIFCIVTRSHLPINVLIQPLDIEVITKDQINILRWARVEVAKRKATKRARELSKDIGL